MIEKLIASEVITLLIALGTLGTMVIKVAEVRRDLERQIEKTVIKDEKLNARLNQLIIALKYKQNDNGRRITQIEQYLATYHSFNIREEGNRSGEDFESFSDFS